jgi:proteasome accessory factor A
MGTTAIVLSMIEAGFLKIGFELYDAVTSMHLVSHDIDLVTKQRLRDGNEMSALEIQKHYQRSAADYLVHIGNLDPMTSDVVDNWGRVLHALETDKMSLANEVDWITKLSVLNGYRNRDQMLWSDPRLAAIDIQYADLRPEKGLGRVLQQKGKLDLLFSEDEIERAIDEPPVDTRAYFRGKCMEKFENEVAAASWDSLIFDIGEHTTLKRVTLPDAVGGTKAMTESLIAQSRDASQLLAAIAPAHGVA